MGKTGIKNRCRTIVTGMMLCLGSVAAAQPIISEQTLKVHLSWGHWTAVPSQFFVQIAGQEVILENLQPFALENGEHLRGTALQSRAGAGDVDGVGFTLRFSPRTIQPITNLHSIWNYLLANSDADTARRLRQDPGYRPDQRKLTVQMNEAGTRGFSVTVDQLLTNRVFWVPALDLFLATGEPAIDFNEHQRQLQPWQGQRVLDLVTRQPEASYEQFAGRWEDMGNPNYKNPQSVGPGHIICLTWDSALPKFGVDRGANVFNDYGNPDHFQVNWTFGDLDKLANTWLDQQLTDGLPVVTTRFERDSVRYEIEQFAYPLNGPPPERRGDIPMVLLERVRLRELSGKPQSLSLRLNHQRELSTNISVGLETNRNALLWQRTSDNHLLLCLAGSDYQVQNSTMPIGKRTSSTLLQAVNLPANGTREFILKLPSPPVPPTEEDKLYALDYASARVETLRFWSNSIARGAQFEVPEAAVNTLFRANLWHALRLPRRHGGAVSGVKLDLPYSNFAYDQRGTPWPVNQAIYVDYMLYDLRGHHAISAEELAAMYRNNQESNGHVGGFANWGVYTPSMIYAVAQHFLLSGDRASFEALLPQTLKALDWCLGEIRKANAHGDLAQGLVLAPLNDLSHEPKAWAFNQAYLFAGPDMLARALAEIGHPRAAECRAAAQAMFDAIQRGFARASMQSPLVQLRDHTWMPYVPADALASGRLLSAWYPTDVDTGALHLSRLKALDPAGPLTTYLLHDHEDNLFFKQWGMANEPVYNQHATAWLLRDEPKAVIRAFYSMMACAFSHSTFEPVEHRWGWGQYFGPPSTDGAWFDLYRHMLIQERDDGTLLLLHATPRKWLEHGKQIRIERAPTYYGPLNLRLDSRAAIGEIRVTIETPARRRPAALFVRLRHPESRPLRSVTVNNKSWRDFDLQQEWIRIPQPEAERYEILARF